MRALSRRIWIIRTILIASTIVIIVLLLLPTIRTLTSLETIEAESLYLMQHHGTNPLTNVLNNLLHLTNRDIQRRARTLIFGTSFVGLNPEGDTIVGHNLDIRQGGTLVLASNSPSTIASVSIVDLNHLGIIGAPNTLKEQFQLLNAVQSPLGGMNESGLTVTTLAVPCRLADLTLPGNGIRPTALVRYLLDHTADVEEAIAIIQESKIWFEGMCSHFMLADTTGQSVIVEFIDGEMIISQNLDPWQVSTNFLVSEWGAKGPQAPCWRYRHAFQKLESRKGALSSMDAMQILKEVDAGSGWSAVFNSTRGQLLLALGMDFEKLHAFQLGESMTDPPTPRQRIAGVPKKIARMIIWMKKPHLLS